MTSHLLEKAPKTKNFDFPDFPEITGGIFRNLPWENLPEFRNSGIPVLTLTWQQR